MANNKKSKVLSFKNPGIIMTLIQLASAILIFVWFPTRSGWLGIPLIAWLIAMISFMWLLQAIVYVLWCERLERAQNNPTLKQTSG